jgi:hypothetical protein
MNRKGANYVSYVKLPDYSKISEYDSDSEGVESEDTDEEYHSNYSFICIEHGSKKTFKKKMNTVILKPEDYISEESTVVAD